MPFSAGQKIEKKIDKKDTSISEIKDREDKPKKSKLSTEIRDIIVQTEMWINKVSRYPIFQRQSTRNSPNPIYKPDGMIGQQLADKLKKILQDNQ